MCEFPRVCWRFTLPWYADLVILQTSHGVLPARPKPKRRSTMKVKIRKRIRSKSKIKTRSPIVQAAIAEGVVDAGSYS